MEPDNIYCTVPDELKEDMQSEHEERNVIGDFLKANKAKFCTAREIARECNFPTRGTQVEVRKLITFLIELDDEPIVANAKGFAYVDNSHQVFFYLKSLEERAQGLQRRIDKVRRIATLMKRNEGEQ